MIKETWKQVNKLNDGNRETSLILITAFIQISLAFTPLKSIALAALIRDKKINQCRGKS